MEVVCCLRGGECKIFLGKNKQYSKSNPFQGEDSEMIWRFSMMKVITISIANMVAV